MLRRKMVYDGHFPDLIVCTDCWDPKHPQEYLPDVTDPETLYDPTGDIDKDSNRLVMSFPPLDMILNNQLMPGLIQFGRTGPALTVGDGVTGGATDGVWSADVWLTGVWATGVWFGT